MLGIEAYIRQNLKRPFWSQTKWIFAPNSGGVATIDETNSGARLIYAFLFIPVTVAAGNVSLKDSQNYTIFEGNTTGIQQQLISIPICHIFYGALVTFTTVGITDFSIGYQWIRDLTDDE